MLTAAVVTQSGPVLLSTLLHHYFGKKAGKSSVARKELLYDEAFVLIKTFLEISTKHTVEDLQKFGLTKTPSPPWVLVHRVLIPINSSCSQAADVLIKALGGPEMAIKISGGTKWWRVRMQAGVEAEWIGIKKDFREEEVRREQEKEKKKQKSGRDRVKEKVKSDSKAEQTEATDDGIEGEFTPEMDHLRCMLYIHGGAGYWGSINTHRYTIWRYARKMRGRCFAVNYRKAPQFPWPCALQDCIAAYLYLIDPPPKAKHRPVDPKNLIIAGDSAGGNLALSLLQVIRDAGLPQPAGAVLISPWSDLTHSFPSVLKNTATDIIPPYGFLHRPSTLWPPPPPELTKEVQETLRSKVKDAVHRITGSHKKTEEVIGKHHETPTEAGTATSPPGPVPEDEETTARGDTVIPSDESGDEAHASTLFPTQEKHPHHHPGPTDQRSRKESISDPAKEKHMLSLEIEGQTVNIRSQIQLYCTNDQLSHPYVSPALGNLAGLPPMFVIASDNEVLRDEILYVAHKAANPEQYPIREAIKDLLPNLKDCEGKYPSTKVHVQVYDGTCHVLPMLSFTEPAKHCYRAIASWCKFVTSRHPEVKQSADVRHMEDDLDAQKAVSSVYEPRAYSSNAIQPLTRATPTSVSAGGSATELAHPILAPVVSEDSRMPSIVTSSPSASRKASLHDTQNSVRYFESQPVTSPTQSIFDGSRDNTPDITEWEATDAELSRSVSPNRTASRDADSVPDRLATDEIKVPKSIPKGYAGNYEIYTKKSSEGPFVDNMIRERVSTRGECRPLEDPQDIPGLNVPLDEIGVVKEAQAERYLRGQKLWDERYKKFAVRAEKHRQDNLRKATIDGSKAEKEFLQHLEDKKKNHSEQEFDQQSYLFDNEFSWSWALQGEQPPPSACVGRRDTSEARKLALMADRLTDESVQLSGLSLWTAMAGILSKGGTSGPGKEGASERHKFFGFGSKK